MHDAEARQPGSALSLSHERLGDLCPSGNVALRETGHGASRKEFASELRSHLLGA
jgi:hypothetical protein